MPPRYGPGKDGLAPTGHLHTDWGGLSSCRTRPAGKERAAPKRGPWVFGLGLSHVAYQPSLSPTRKNRSSMPYLSFGGFSNTAGVAVCTRLNDPSEVGNIAKPGPFRAPLGVPP